MMKIFPSAIDRPTRIFYMDGNCCLNQDILYFVPQKSWVDLRWESEMGKWDGKVRWESEMGKWDGKVRWESEMGKWDGKVRWESEMREWYEQKRQFFNLKYQGNNTCDDRWRSLFKLRDYHQMERDITVSDTLMKEQMELNVEGNWNIELAK
jgi:hypothetical protein